MYLNFTGNEVVDTGLAFTVAFIINYLRERPVTVFGWFNTAFFIAIWMVIYCFFKYLDEKHDEQIKKKMDAEKYLPDDQRE